MELDKVFLGDFKEHIETLEDESIDFILTDPPFGQDKEYGRRELGARTIMNDDNLLWLPDFCLHSYRILKPDKYLVAFCQWETKEIFKTFLNAHGFTTVTVGVWDKGNAGLGAGFAEGYENFLVMEKGKAPRDFFTSNLIREPRVSGRPIHPHQKPIKLFKKLLDFCTKKDYIVYDPFLGSGTTVYACKDLERHYLGCEKDMDYYNYILSTIRQLDSQQDFFKQTNDELGTISSKM